MRVRIFNLGLARAEAVDVDGAGGVVEGAVHVGHGEAAHAQERLQVLDKVLAGDEDDGLLVAGDDLAEQVEQVRDLGLGRDREKRQLHQCGSSEAAGVSQQRTATSQVNEERS